LRAIRGPSIYLATDQGLASSRSLTPSSDRSGPTSSASRSIIGRREWRLMARRLFAGYRVDLPTPSRRRRRVCRKHDAAIMRYAHGTLIELTRLTCGGKSGNSGNSDDGPNDSQLR
jgi:hypothetical protein